MGNLIGEIELHAQSKTIISYLHFETHGNEYGLGTNNGDSISWEEFRLLLIRINYSIKNNLFVSVAACFGGFIFHSISMLERLPFCAFVGPPTDTFPDEIQIDWQAYFQTLLSTRSFGQAVDALNENNPRFRYIYYSSESLIDLYLKSYLERFENEHFVKERVEHVVSLAKQDPILSARMNENQMRQFVIQKILEQPEFIKKLKDYIMMKTDALPEV